MINTQFVRAFFVAILSQDKLYFTVLSQNEYKQKQTNLRKSNTQLTHLQYKIKSNMKNIKGYTHTFWSPSKLGVAGLSPVFRSLEIKQLHENVAAFFFVFHALSQFCRNPDHKNVKKLTRILTINLSLPYHYVVSDCILLSFQR